MRNHLLVACLAFLLATPAMAEEWAPKVGQQGKDVIWVPSPEVTVETMLDLARLTPDDYVIDLGSGDGRVVIAAARRGARGHGVEFNSKLVEFSRKRAIEAGVADRATFMEGDMYEADISQATVMPLFLLSENLNLLVPKFLDLQPGSRIVTNGYTIDDWEYKRSERAGGDCNVWCHAYLYIVPAKVEGIWRLGEGELRIAQHIEDLHGTFDGVVIQDGRIRGTNVVFSVGADRYAGVVDGELIRFSKASGPRGAEVIATRVK